MRKYSESIMKIVFLLSAAVSILAVLLICWFLFSEGLPTIGGNWRIELPDGNGVETARKPFWNSSDDCRKDVM